MFRTNTLAQTIELALLHEKTMETILKEVKASNKNGDSIVNSMGIRMNLTSQLPPIKRISTTEMQERWGKILCYYCDEKYESGHKCKRKQNFLLDGHESEVEEICEAENNIKKDDLVVSINAIFGSKSHQTMRIHGNIKKKVVTILIDSRNTHNGQKNMMLKYELPNPWRW